MADARGWDEPTRRAAATYGSAADHFDRPALSFWDRFGAATVARLSLAPGYDVADLCCGAGASALPAARAVAPGGRVLAIDVAAPLLELARVRAARDGAHNVEFRLGDATSTGLPDAGFDAVLCVFGVFFAADMPGFVREMWRLVRPGGTLAVTTWGPDLFEPGTSVFWEEVGRVDPALVRAFNPWDAITTSGALVELLATAGVPQPAAHAEPGSHRLAEPAAFWDIVLGSGYRATVDALGAAPAEQVRAAVTGRLARSGTTAVRTDVVYGVATRPAA